jgi:hypothetical protein
MIVGEVCREDSSKVTLAENDDMVRGPPRYPCASRVDETPARRVVAIAQQRGGCGVIREGVHDLLGRPLGGGMFGHVEVYDAPPMVSEHDENEEYAQACRGNREEIEGDEISDMIGEERPPRLGWRCAPLRQQPGNGTLREGDAELEELGMDAWCTPEGDSPRPCA